MTQADNQEKEIPISWDRLLWCNVHGQRIEKVTQRNGVTHYHCGPRRGGITMPCICTELTGLVEITVEPDICPGCKNEIDPDVCCCGDPIRNGYHDNHSPVPMGCDCHRAKTPQEKLAKELEHPWG